MRRIMTVAAIGLAGATLTACGSPPEDASTEDFCKAWTSFGETIATDKVDEDKVKDAVSEIEEVGTPKEIEGDAREGFELSVDLLNDVDFGADDVTAELEKADEDVSDEDQKKLDAFEKKSGELCGGAEMEPETETETDADTDTATDEATDEADPATEETEQTEVETEATN